MSFHDDKLWQEAYVPLLDLLEVTENLEGNDVAKRLRKHAMHVLTEIAQGVASRDRKFRDMKLREAGNYIVSLRSLLSVLWGQESLSDDQFGKLDAAYESLSNKLPR